MKTNTTNLEKIVKSDPPGWGQVAFKVKYKGVGWGFMKPTSEYAAKNNLGNKEIYSKTNLKDKQ